MINRVRGGNMQHYLIGKWIGYVTLKIEGENHEKFFQTCLEKGYKIWDIKTKDKNICTCKTYTNNVKRLQYLFQEREGYTISIIDEKGYFPYFKKFWLRKEYIIAFILCIALIFILSNIIWKVKITGVSTELENKITEQLSAYGIYEGAWIYSIDSIESIQDDILNNMEELLYIGIEKRGTSILVDGIEKLIIKEKEQKTAKQLIAAKNGVIEKMFVKKGYPLVNTNDYVKKGDILVAGDVVEEGENEKGTENAEAEGEVYANTWYEVSVSSSMYSYYEKLTGERLTKYFLVIGKLQIPIWPLKKASFDEQYVETENEDIYFIKWKIPIQLKKEFIYNKASMKQSRTEEQTKEYAIQQALNHLQLKLGKNSEIITHYVLQDVSENGKVKLNLYVSVVEDIATGKN